MSFRISLIEAVDNRTLARTMHRFLSRSDESADLTRRVTRNTGGAHSTTDDFVAAVENLCIVRANPDDASCRCSVGVDPYNLI